MTHHFTYLFIIEPLIQRIHERRRMDLERRAAELTPAGGGGGEGRSWELDRRQGTGGTGDSSGDRVVRLAADRVRGHSTVTDLARLRGWSTSQPRRTAMW